MDGLDVQRFISDQRSKLSQEKARLFENERSPRGIIPSGSQMSKRSEVLRQERYAEYQDFLESRKKAPKSIAEIRREMAHKREQEISSQSASNTNSSTNRQTQGQSSTVSDAYDSLRSRKREEERQYRGATYYNNGEGEQRARRRLNDEAPPPTTHQRVRFKEKRGGGVNEIKNRGYSRGWEEDERELMTWAHGGGSNRQQESRNGSRSRQHLARARTPPEVESPRKRGDQDAQKSAKMRSISAPVVHDHYSDNSGGIFGLGGREDNAETKRNKQKEYAEILRAQIKEREEAKERERVREEMMEVRDTEDEKPSLRNKNSRQISQKSAHDDEMEEYRYKERSPPPQRMYHERYTPYQPPLSRFNDHPPYHGPPYNWESPYYPYYPPQPPPRGDPNFNYYPPDPYHNPYYHPSHRFPPPPPPQVRGENPYFPPRHEFEHGPPHRDRWENYEDEYSTKTWKKDYKSEYDSKRSRDLSSQDKRNPEETSPLHGGGGSGQRGVAMDKAAYRAELTQQMKEKKQNELKAKLKREMEDSKKEMEVYDPFGKGGCGAPVRDQHGNLVADLKQMRKINQERLNLSTSPSHRPASGGGGDDQPSDSPRTILTYDKVDQETQKQAGHMTYRDFLRQQVEEKEKKKEEEKRQQMMEEQRELERLEKERKKLEEDFKRERERERQREEEARRKNEQLKREAEEKKRQTALLAEEQQRREAEQERQLAEAKLRALAERMAQPLPPQRRTYSPPIPTFRNKDNRPPPQTSVVAQQQSQMVLAAQEEPVFRSSSPPVPAVLKKMAQEQQNQTEIEPKESTAPQIPSRVGTNSPPPLLTQRQPSSSTLLPSSSEVPHHSPPRGQTQQPLPTTSAAATIQPAASATIATDNQPSDILKQLAAMRMHLQAELVKKDAIQQRSDHAGIFERARQQRPKIPGPRIARPKDSTTLNALNQFTHLKYTNPSRGDFVSKYPDLPDTESVLELQQDALLRHQEQQLASLKVGKERDRGAGAAIIKQRRHQPLFDGNPLTSDSLNLPLGDKGDPFQLPSTTSQDHMSVSMATTEGGTKVPDHARRHRQWGEEGRGQGGGGTTRVPSPGSQSQFSVTTFDVDSMAMRNDERARRLDAILNAGTSGNVNHLPRGGGRQHLKNHRQDDPQTILHDFLRKTDHRRGGGSRQSERSLDCETDYQRISSPHS